MGLFKSLFGWREYFDKKYDEFLKVIQEGFVLRDQKIMELEGRPPIVRQIVQTVDLPQEKFNEMLQEALKNEGIKDKILLSEKKEPTRIEEPETVFEEEPPPPITEEGPKILQPRTIAISTQQQSFIDTLPAVREIEYRKDLPKKLKPVIALLFNSGIPMTAEEIIEHFPNISLPTVRTYLHELQKTVIPVEVRKRPDRKNEYSLSPKTKAEILTFFKRIE